MCIFHGEGQECDTEKPREVNEKTGVKSVDRRLLCCLVTQRAKLIKSHMTSDAQREPSGEAVVSLSVFFSCQSPQVSVKKENNRGSLSLSLLFMRKGEIKTG